MDALGAPEIPLTQDADHPGPEVSEAIRIARVFCIFFMIFVHVHPGTTDFVPDEAGIRLFDVLRFLVVDSLGRASVALLSVVAGFLAVYSLRRETAGVFLRKKSRSLLVPLVLWNLILITLVIFGNLLHEDYIEKSFDGSLTVARLPELILGLGGKPANEPLAFLRDVFVCALFTPLLLASLRRSTRWFVAVAGVLVLLAAVTPIGIRPSIPALYAAGMFIAERRLAPVPSLKLVLPAVIAFAALGAVLAWRDLTSDDGARTGLTWLEAGFNVIRIPAAIVFWSLALALTGSGLGKRLSRLEPYIFTAFCIHVIVSKVVWAAWEPLFGGYYGALYPVFFFGIPVLVITSAVIGARVLNARVPWFFSLLNGGRNLATRRKRSVPVGASGLVLEPART
jgi:hypothetical protein